MSPTYFQGPTRLPSRIYVDAGKVGRVEGPYSTRLRDETVDTDPMGRPMAPEPRTGGALQRRLLSPRTMSEHNPLTTPFDQIGRPGAAGETSFSDPYHPDHCTRR